MCNCLLPPQDWYVSLHIPPQVWPNYHECGPNCHFWPIGDLVYYWWYLFDGSLFQVRIWANNFLIYLQKNKSIIILCIKSAEIDLSRIDAKNSDFSYRIQFLIIKKRILFVYFENMCSENSTRPPCHVFQQKNIILFDKTN